jgi:OTU domain-containing protein 5
MESNIHIENEPFYLDEPVDVIRIKEDRVVDAQILSIRGNIIVVRYLDSKESESIHLEDNLIIKKWRPGRPFKRYNRVDYRNNNIWYEALVLNVEPEKIYLKYKIRENEVHGEWVPMNGVNKNIAPIGKYSGNFNPHLHSCEEINHILYRKKKQIKANHQQEQKFRNEIRSINLNVKEIVGDGNCLYRAVCDQVYGAEDHYEIIKSKCFDYLDLERDFFSKFIEGGIDKFDDYLQMKRVNGVWGDDIEIQALSEIYNRSIEIYSHSKEPLKTFHEVVGSSIRGVERNNVNQTPIRLSYHGRAHYNSLTQINPEYKDYLTSHPGEFESNVLERVKIKLTEEKNTNSADVSKTHNEKLEISRGNFIQKSI